MRNILFRWNALYLYESREQLFQKDPPEKFDPSRPAFQGHWRGSPCSWVSAFGVRKNTMMGLPGEEKFNDSRLEYTIHEWDGQKPADSNYQAYA